MKRILCILGVHDWYAEYCKGTPLRNHGWLGWLSGWNFTWKCIHCGKTKDGTATH